MSHFAITHNNHYFGTFSNVKHRSVVFCFRQYGDAQKVSTFLKKKGVCLNMDHVSMFKFEAKYTHKLCRPIDHRHLCIEWCDGPFQTNTHVNNISLFIVDNVTITENVFELKGKI